MGPDQAAGRTTLARTDDTDPPAGPKRPHGLRPSRMGPSSGHGPATGRPTATVPIRVAAERGITLFDGAEAYRLVDVAGAGVTAVAK